MKKRQGFTLIEVVLYSVVISIIMLALLPAALNIITNGEKSMTMQEVASNGRNILDQIKYKIRNANAVVSVTSNTLTLSNHSGANTVITLSGGNVTMSEGTAVNLNSGETTVSALTFTDYSSADGRTDNIAVSLTIAGNFSAGGRQEYTDSVTLQTAAEVR